MNSSNKSSELHSSERASSPANHKYTNSYNQSKEGLNNPSTLFEYLSSSINSENHLTKSSSQYVNHENMPFSKQKFASADSIPYPLQKLEESKENQENSDFNSEAPLVAKYKSKSASFGSIPLQRSPTGEKKRHKPPMSPLNLAPPGKITNPSQFSQRKSDSSRHSDESMSEEKSDSSSRNPLNKDESELNKFLEYKKQADSESGKKPVQQELGKFATFSIKDVRNYLKTKN